MKLIVTYEITENEYYRFRVSDSEKQRDILDIDFMENEDMNRNFEWACAMVGSAVRGSLLRQKPKIEE
jgi:hypothetical protein